MKIRNITIKRTTTSSLAEKANVILSKAFKVSATPKSTDAITWYDVPGLSLKIAVQNSAGVCQISLCFETRPGVWHNLGNFENSPLTKYIINELDLSTDARYDGYIFDSDPLIYAHELVHRLKATPPEHTPSKLKIAIEDFLDALDPQGKIWTRNWSKRYNMSGATASRSKIRSAAIITVETSTDKSATKLIAYLKGLGYEASLSDATIVTAWVNPHH